MQTQAASGGDWRDGTVYAPLLDADRSLFAWEWLRRDPEYCKAVCGSGDNAPERFGLVAFEPPDLPVPLARPVWSAAVHPFVLPAEKKAQGCAGALFDPKRLAPFARIVPTGGTEHLLLSNGLRTLRLDGRPGTFNDGPASLSFTIDSLATAHAQLLTLKRLIGLSQHGRFEPLLHPAEPRARRWVLLLRTTDALGSGANQREIAHVLLGRASDGPQWRDRDPSLRCQAQRLVRSARRFAAGEYLSLLT